MTDRRAMLCGVLLCSLFAASLPGPLWASDCGDPLQGTGTHEFTFEGLTRTYRLSLPPDASANQPMPLIMVFHGWGGDESEFLQFDRVIEAAGQHGYALVAPRGLGSGAPDQHNNSWTFSGSDTGLDGNGGPICNAEITSDYRYSSCAGTAANSCSWTQCQQDDVAFTLALLEHLNGQVCLDQQRIFAVGGSNGGMFTWELAQNPASAGNLRAFASLIGLPHRGYLAGPGRDGDLPVLLVTGQQDPTVPPGEWGDKRFTTTSNGTDRFYYESASAITSKWAQAHDCQLSDGAERVATPWEQVDCRSFCASDGGLPQVLDCRADMGHTYELDWAWPLVLQFFDDQGGKPSP